MDIGILGSGIVGQVLGRSLAASGHAVVLGTRSPDNLEEKRGMGASLGEWVSSAGDNAGIGTFAEAASHGEMLINATSGQASVAAIELAGATNTNGKVLMDVANPLDFSKGMPPSLAICNTDSLGETIQRAFPSIHVVKTLNTVTASVMVDPGAVGNGEHHMFVCGNDDGAKATVVDCLRDWFGWRHILDLGDIAASRSMEMYLPIWLRLWGAQETPLFNILVVRQA